MINKNLITFCHILRCRNNRCKITSSKQLVPAKNTYGNFQKITEAKSLNRKLINPKKILSPNRVSRRSKNNWQFIIGLKTCLKREKKRKTANKGKIVSIFVNFVIFLYKKMRHIHKTVTNCYQNISQVISVFSVPN